MTPADLEERCQHSRLAYQLLEWIAFFLERMSVVVYLHQKVASVASIFSDDVPLSSICDQVDERPNCDSNAS